MLKATKEEGRGLKTARPEQRMGGRGALHDKF